MRIGHGVDAHRLGEGRPLMMGGIHIPYKRGLLGHSDGDVVAHALGAALLGGAGLGDLGRHFPSGEPQWSDMSGRDLLAQVAGWLAEASLCIESAQVVAIAQEPRLAPHLEAMATAVAAALGAPRGTVAITATTVDGLGFTGRGEGIAASAVALLASLS
ncbi:MAG: 2-C-methyl-D-erythritol 2,4-cyclodiphosphate synthase [Candidatus Dormibacteria bacterium]